MGMGGGLSSAVFFIKINLSIFRNILLRIPKRKASIMNLYNQVSESQTAWIENIHDISSGLI